MQAVQVKVGADKVEELQGKIVDVKINGANTFYIEGILA